MNLKAADDGVAGGCSTMGWGSEGDMSSVCGRAGGWVGSGLIYWRIGKRARTPVPAKQKPIRKPSQKKMIIMIMRRRRRRKERERAKNGNLCSTRHFLHIFMEKTGFYCWRKAKIVVCFFLVFLLLLHHLLRHLLLRLFGFLSKEKPE